MKKWQIENLEKSKKSEKLFRVFDFALQSKFPSFCPGQICLVNRTFCLPQMEIEKNAIRQPIASVARLTFVEWRPALSQT